MVHCDISEHQDIAGAKALVFRVVDKGRCLTNGNLQITSATKHKSFLEMQFEELVLDTIRELFIEVVAVSGDYVPFVETGRVAITLKFRKFQNCSPIIRGHVAKACHFILLVNFHWTD